MAWDKTVPTTTSKIKDGPSTFQSNWDAFEWWSNKEHYQVDHATMAGAHKPGQCSVVMVDTTAVIATLTNVACAVAFDITLNLFAYNDGAGWVNMGGPIESGTKMLFYADTAPVGWTLDTALDNKIAFITKGSVVGGQTGGIAHTTGQWVITGWGGVSDDHAITILETPAHTHTYSKMLATVNSEDIGSDFVPFSPSTGSTGGGAAHTHTISSNVTQDGLWRPSAYNFIICTKN